MTPIRCLVAAVAGHRASDSATPHASPALASAIG